MKRKGCLSNNSENLKTRATKERNGLKIVSLRKHGYKLDIVLNGHDKDIIGLSETLLGKTISDCEVNISDNNIFRNDRDVNGGGAAIYIKASLPEPTVRIKSGDLELISLEIAPKHAKPFLVVCGY